MNQATTILTCSEQVVRGHRRKACIDHPRLAFLHPVDGGLHVVVDPAPGHAAERGKRPRVRIEQHLVALRRIRLHDKGTAVAQLQVRHEHLAPHPADDQVLLAPVELMRLTRLELQWNEGLRDRFAAFGLPAPDELGDAAVIAVKPLRLQLRKQLQRRTPVPLRSPCISLKHLHQLRRVRRDLGVAHLSLVLRLNPLGRLQPLADRLARQSRATLDLREREPLPVVQPSYLPQQIHGDHLLCSPLLDGSGGG